MSKQKPKKKEIEYPHKKYELLNDSLKALAQGTINLLILKGDCGWGKSFTALDFAKKGKFNHAYIHSYTTPLSFYEIVYDNRNRQILIFDDLDGLEDTKIIAMMKGACWGVLGDQREMAYFSKSEKMGKLPSKFKLKKDLGIILIMNDYLKGFKPIIDRGFKIEFSYNFQEKIKILENMQKKANLDKQVLEFVKSHCTPAIKNLSIRTLVRLSNLKKDGYDWLKFAKEELEFDENKQLLLTKLPNCHDIGNACQEWKNETHLSERTFYRYYKSMGGKKLRKKLKKEAKIHPQLAEAPALEPQDQSDLPEYLKGGEENKEDVKI